MRARGPRTRSAAAILLASLFSLSSMDALGALGTRASGPQHLLNAGQRPAYPGSSLIVVFVVDMLPSGKLEALRPMLSGGLRRMLDAGRVHPSCAHAHAATLTGPGHATLLSGLLPRNHGIIMNDWYDLEAHRKVYCVEGSVEVTEAGVAASSRSPRLLLGEDLADLMKRSNAKSQVYGVAGKDRSAILSTGHSPDGAFWYDESTGGFTGDPAAVARLGGGPIRELFVDAGATPSILAGIPDDWTYPQRPGAQPDDYPYEVPPRVAPHTLRAKEGTTTGAAAARSRARNIQQSPWLDWLTLELASRLLAAQGLGRDDAPDLLVVGLSSADFVGHQHGPDSQEYVDTLVRLDGWLGEFMKRADAAAQPGGAVFALSSDHGVLPLPETRSSARRVDGEAMLARLQSMLTARLDPNSTAPFVESTQGGHLYLDRRALAASGVSLEKAVEEARRILSDFREVARVYRASDLAGGLSGDPDLDLNRASWHPDRGGDLVVQPCRECLFTSRPEGTSHGTPYDYDRLVPLILMGPGIEPGVSDAQCRTVDLAPTLAELLGLSFATPRDGRPLPGASAPAAP